MPSKGVIRGPSLSILGYYMAPFFLWIYFLWVWFDFFHANFSASTVQHSTFLQNWGPKWDWEISLSYLHTCKSNGTQYKVAFHIQNWAIWELQLPFISSVKGNWMILTQYDSCFLFNIRVNNRKEKKKEREIGPWKGKNTHLYHLGYSKAKIKLVSSCFLKTFNRTLGSRKESITVFFTAQIL